MTRRLTALADFAYRRRRLMVISWIVGAILIAIALFMPRGVSGLIEDVRKWRRPATPPSAVLLPAEAGVPKS